MGRRRSQTKSTIFYIAVLTVLALGVQAASGFGAKEASSVGGAGSTGAGASNVGKAGVGSSGATDANGKPGELTLVMVPKGVHPYFEPVYRGFQAAAKKYGVQVEMDAPPKFDVSLQVKVIEDLIARGVNGIAISADDDRGLVKVIHEAMKAGIKVITFDAPAPSSEALTYIGTNNEQAGYEAGIRMAKAMGYEGKLAILQGGLQATNLNLRTAGFKRALAKVAPRIDVVAVADEHGDFAESIIKTEELLKKYPDLHGIFSVSAEGAPSAATVIKEQRRTGTIVVAGFDDLKDTLDGIRDGSVAFCVVQNTYKMGWLSVEELLAAIDGKPIPKVIDTGVVFVDRSNLATYSGQMRSEVVQQ